MDKNNFINFKMTKEILEKIDKGENMLNISYILKNNQREDIKINGNLFEPYFYNEKLNIKIHIANHTETQKNQFN
jgi:hypothetical protein